MSRGPDAQVLLERALLQGAAAMGCAARIVSADRTPWASATFEGMRHALVLEAAAGAATDGWLAGLAEAELPLRGHLLADCIVQSVERSGLQTRARIEALTLEER